MTLQENSFIGMVYALSMLLWIGCSVPAKAEQGDLRPILVRSGDMELQISYQHVPGSQNITAPLTNGTILRPGDSYRIVVIPAREIYLYIYETSTTGLIQQTFPGDPIRGGNSPDVNPVRRGQMHGVTGRVTTQNPLRSLYVVSSPARHRQLEEQYRFMAEAQRQQNAHRAQLIQTELLRTIQSQSVSHVTPVVHTNWIDSRSFQNPATPNEIVRVLQMPIGAVGRRPLSTKGVTADGETTLSAEELEELPKATLLNLFAERSAAILPESYPLLVEYGKSLQTALQDAEFIIAVHSDNQGTEIENNELTRRRANAIRQLWRDEFGIAGQRLQIKAQGGKLPMVSNETAEGRRLNNRVELIRVK